MVVPPQLHTSQPALQLDQVPNCSLKTSAVMPYQSPSKKNLSVYRNNISQASRATKARNNMVVAKAINIKQANLHKAEKMVR